MTLNPCVFSALLAAALLLSRVGFRNRKAGRSYAPFGVALVVALVGLLLSDLPAYLAFFASLGITLTYAFIDRPGSKTEPSSYWEPDLTESDRIAEERALQEELDLAKSRRSERE